MEQLPSFFNTPKFSANNVIQRLPDIPPPPALPDATEKEPEQVIEPPQPPEIQQNALPMFPKFPRFFFGAQPQPAPVVDLRPELDLIPKDGLSNSTEQLGEQSLMLSNSKKIVKEKSAHLTRKIVKNYGKAIASFACCEKAHPILDKILNKNIKQKEEFIAFVYENKEFIEGNRRLMQLLIISENESEEMQRNKKVFKIIAQVFMKKYVQQWLWNSKLVNKELHAQLLKEMRKRIRYPELLEHLSE